MAAMPTIYVLNGPNLNLLGTREPEIYGTQTLADIMLRLTAKAYTLGFALDVRQSNHEGDLIDWMQQAASEGAHAILLNAAGYTHSSIALHDTIKAIPVPVFEVHLSDPQKREPFRHMSYIESVSRATFAGHGAHSYDLALDAAAAL